MAHSTPLHRRGGRSGGADAWYDLSIARIVALALLVIPLLAGLWVFRAGPFAAEKSADADSSLARQIAGFNPRTLFSEETRHFLPPPVAALPAEANAGPPAPSAGDQAARPGARERVKVANTGGVGAVLRAAPRTGQRVASLRDGQVLEVLERQVAGDEEWLKVRTPEGGEGWIYGRLVGPAA